MRDAVDAYRAQHSALASPSDRFLDEITVLILTWNEAANIARVLAPLARFKEIVVLDSGSVDGTVELAQGAANVRVVQRAFDTHAAQWNHGLVACGISTDWVLALDGDYVLGRELIDEIAALRPGHDVSGYRLSFRYCVGGRPLSASLYPPVTALFRRARAHYAQAGHTQRLVLDGTIRALANRALHDDRKPWARWLLAQRRYARLEAQYLLDPKGSARRPQDRVRRLVIAAPILVFFHTLLVKGLVRDGWRGWAYALQRGLAEAIIARALVHEWLRRLRRRQPSPSARRSTRRSHRPSARAGSGSARRCARRTGSRRS